jgi:CheY-like chemotaxis protein
MDAAAWRVLVVDDSPPNVELAAFLLTRGGLVVGKAGNAVQADAKLREFKPHLVLMDVQMPETDGLTLTLGWKADERHAGLVVLAFTAYAMKGDREKLVASGFDGYIAKPIDVATFVEEVRRHLPPRRV